MDSYRFDSEMSFSYVRRTMEEIDRPEHKELMAKLIWLEGSAKEQSVPFLYDPMAERFGHSVDKSALHEEVTASLYNGIAVEVQLRPRTKRE